MDQHDEEQRLVMHLHLSKRKMLTETWSRKTLQIHSAFLLRSRPSLSVPWWKHEPKESSLGEMSNTHQKMSNILRRSQQRKLYSTDFSFGSHSVELPQQKSIGVNLELEKLDWSLLKNRKEIDRALSSSWLATSKHDKEQRSLEWYIRRILCLVHLVAWSIEDRQDLEICRRQSLITSLCLHFLEWWFWEIAQCLCQGPQCWRLLHNARERNAHSKLTTT